jgi:hypothetical protein
LQTAQIWRELAPHYFPKNCFGGSSHYFPTDCFGGSSKLEGTGSILFYGGLFWKFGGNWLHIIFWRIVLEAAQIWRELASHYFPTDCFGGSSNLEGNGCTLFSERLFRRQLKFGGNWLHIIFWQIVLVMWRELASHFILPDCFGGSSNLAEMAQHYFPTDCFGGKSNLEGTGCTLFFDRLFWRQLKFGGNWLQIIFRRIVLEIWRELAPHYFPGDCFVEGSDLEEIGSTLFSSGLFWRRLRFGGK